MMAWGLVVPFHAIFRHVLKRKGLSHMEAPRPRPSLRIRILQAGLSIVQGAQQGLAGAQLYLRSKIAFEHRLRTRPDDIFISTYPRSGTTLLQMMVHQLRGDGEMDIPHINAVVPWLEPAVLANQYDFLDALSSPRVFKTHLPRELLPRGAQYIYCVRDVREVFVSSAHHQSMMLGRRIPTEAFAGHFGQGKIHGTWFEHLESWWPHRNDPDVLFLTFQGMTADLEGTVRRVAAFCGLPLDEAAMPRILERCGFEFMKRHSAKFDPRLQQTEELPTFIRKGKTGQWQDELPAAHGKRLEQQARVLALKLGAGDLGGEDLFSYLVRGNVTGPREPAPRQVATCGDGR